MSPFGMVGGMGMPSDGSGEFEVKPPEELSTFADVGSDGPLSSTRRRSDPVVAADEAAQASRPGEALPSE
jgi:hypothetical protein